MSLFLGVFSWLFNRQLKLMDIRPESDLVSQTLGEAFLDGSAGIDLVALIRGEKTLSPSPELTLLSADRVLIIAPREASLEGQPGYLTK